MVFSKPVDQLTREDVERVVADAEPEGKHLEYKEMLPGGTDSERKEFLADVSSFANASGGHIIYGVTAKKDANGRATNLPDVAVGVAVTNADAEILRLNDILRRGLDPRLSRCSIRPIDGFSRGPGFVVEIARSFTGPHMVTYADSGRFFARNESGKYQLDVRELRSAFLVGPHFSDRARRFLIERLDIVCCRNWTPAN